MTDLHRAACDVVLRSVEQAALAAWPWSGKGDAHAADGAATSAMRRVFSDAPFGIRVVIGEGERDGAPLLARGEHLGVSQGPFLLDCAVDPLEGTSLLAQGCGGAMSAAVLASAGGLLGAPDFYMEKLVCPPPAKGFVRLAQSPSERVRSLAQALDKPASALRIAVQDRPRHRPLVAALKDAGAMVELFSEGDVAMALQVAEGGVCPGACDALMGIGAAPEGVIAAAAVRCLGGLFEGRFAYDPEEVMSGLIGTCKETNRQRLQDAGIQDPDAHLSLADLVPASFLVVALCGITSGPFLGGVEALPEGKTSTSARLYQVGLAQSELRTTVHT
jgi:fructose-1,6-bisphosphatase II / sedoheptulose-1,7-bisphosphatase